MDGAGYSILRLRHGSLAMVLAASVAPLPAAELSGFDCLIEPHAVVEVSTREDGVLNELLAERGDFVKKDQVLAKLESGVEEVAVELARARTQMRADLESKRVAIKYLERQLARIEELFAKKAVAFHEKDKAKTDVTMAELELRAAQENMRVAKLEYKRAKQALARRTIRSPVDGVVVERMLLPGESVEDRPIMRVAQVTPLNVEVILPADLYGAIKFGMQGEVRALLPDGGVHMASVTVVDQVIDAASNTFGIRLELPNPGYTIPGGIRCAIRLLPQTD